MSTYQQTGPPPPQQYGGQVKTTNGLAVAGFVAALVGLLLAFIPLVNLFGCLVAIVGLGLGVIGLLRSRQRGVGKAHSIAAIILAVVAFPIAVAVNMAVVRMIEPPWHHGGGQSLPTTVVRGMGQSVGQGNFTYVVRSVSCGMATSGGSLPSRPQGEFCAVELSVANLSKSEQLFDANLVRGFVGGDTIKVDSAATRMAHPEDNILEKSLSPGDSVEAVLLMDVPVYRKLDHVELLPASGDERAAVVVVIR